MDAERLYREHSAALYRYLVRYCGDPELAADAVQDAFLRLLARPPRPEAAKAWLFRVGTNHVQEKSRTRRRRLQLLRSHPHRVPLPDGPADPAEAMDRRELRAGVRAALDELGERDRRVLLMRAEGFTHREIAEAIGKGQESIGSIVLRALRKLDQRLGSEVRR